MKALIKHLIINNLDEIVSKSILNCHCKGLHSIMLLEAPEKTIRLFVAVRGNEMYKNFYTDNNKVSTSIAFHPHHCNLTLHCIKGRFVNWTMKPSKDGYLMTKYFYRSKIKDGDMAFTSIGKEYLKTDKYSWISEGDSVQMNSNTIHTVACFENSFTAWLVYEGKEDNNYIPFCWTNSNPNTQDSEGLYTKPNIEQIQYLLTECGLIE